MQFFSKLDEIAGRAESTDTTTQSSTTAKNELMTTLSSFLIDTFASCKAALDTLHNVR
jgi:hypothetical protein